eukprot:TRINITY_DN102301_c0_g1_i1.p1 TRINITY_DN102301_c0_g1~~TRINITY_DN102301_c0_g1_i1.p1  ORF type:complete len:300 (+),score=84.67 TRINITY_DN102301_c0_g1_i1:49-948(+)
MKRLLVAAFFAGQGDARTLRHVSAGPALPPMPWIGKHMLKAADQQVAVAEAAMDSSEQGQKALLAEEEKVAAEHAVEQATGVVVSAPPVGAQMQKALHDAREYAEEAEAYAEHAAKVKRELVKLPEEAALKATKAVEEQVRIEAYTAAENVAAKLSETDAARTERAASATAAAAEPYHIAILRAQKNVQISLAKSRSAADTVNKLATESQAIAKKANLLQGQGETMLARQLLLQAHQKMQKSMDMKYWVSKFYKDASDWNDTIRKYQAQQQMALGTASATFVEKTPPILPPIPTMEAGA